MSTTTTVHRRKLAPAGSAAEGVAVRAASLHPRATASGNFVPDPVTLELTERAEHPMLTPSWKSFRTYASSNPEFAELKSQGLVPMMRAHQGLRLAIYAVAAALVLVLAALLAYWWLMPATADADSPYVTVDSATANSTDPSQWEKGVIPSLYQNDDSWGHVPYGQAAMDSTGAAPTALAMAYIATTGDTTYTPVEFAQWATDHDMTAAGADTVAAYLQQAGAEFGLALEPLFADAHGLRCAIVSNVPVLVVTQPGTFAPAASVVVLDDIDKDSRITLHDPASPSRSAKSWPFDDIIDATAAAFEVHAA